MLRKLIFLLVVFVLASGAAAAAEWTQRVSMMTQNHGQVERTFNGPEGLQGLIIGPAAGAEDNGRVLAWGTQEGLLIVGNVYDRNGRNLSEVVRQDKPEWFEANNQATPGSVVPASVTTTASTSGDAVWQEAMSFLDAGRAVKQGSGERVFVFTESSCPYCRKFYEAAQATPGFFSKYEVVWVPVARTRSNLKTGAILTGDMSILTNPQKSVSLTQAQESIVVENSFFLQEKGGRNATPAFLIQRNGRSEFKYGLEMNEFLALMGK